MTQSQGLRQEVRPSTQDDQRDLRAPGNGTITRQLQRTQRMALAPHLWIDQLRETEGLDGLHWASGNLYIICSIGEKHGNTVSLGASLSVAGLIYYDYNDLERSGW